MSLNLKVLCTHLLNCNLTLSSEPVKPKLHDKRSNHTIYTHVSIPKCMKMHLRHPRPLGRMTIKSTRRVLGHSLLRSLVRSHRSLIRLIRTARFARALRCSHSFALLLTHSVAHWKEVFVDGMNASILYSFSPLCKGHSGFAPTTDR